MEKRRTLGEDLKRLEMSLHFKAEFWREYLVMVGVGFFLALLMGI